MISDDELYRLAIFLGSAAMLLIIIYHFLEVNSDEDKTSESETKTAPVARGDSKVGSSVR